MRLGYLISQYPALSHTFILREVRALRAAGFEVCTVSIRPPDRALEHLSGEEAEEARRSFSVLGAGLGHAAATNLRVLARHPLRYLRGLAHAWRLTRGTPALLGRYTAYFLEAVVAGEHFRRRGVAVVHTHFSSTVLLIMARMFELRYSLTVHGSDEFVDVVGFHMAAKVAGAVFVATVSRYGASQVMKPSDPAHWHKILVLRLGVDPETFAPRAWRSRRADEPFRLLSVGRLSPPKGYPVLLAAVALLRTRGRAVELTLVGEGPARAALEEYLRVQALGAWVRLAGAANHDRIADYYHASDAFVLSSFAEGVPVVLMEAMATELPCVATWITGIPELIENGVEGLLVPPASPDALADAIEQLIDDPELARRLGVAARRKVLAHYHLGANVAQLAEVFRERLLGASPAAAAAARTSAGGSAARAPLPRTP